MKSLTVILIVALGIMGFAGSALSDEKSTGNITSLEGTYDLYKISEPWRGVVAWMTIFDQRGSEFSIKGDGWSGQGQVQAASGYYDWKFTDGKTGRTTFTYNSEVHIEGHVVGSGINWKYIARKRPVQAR